MGKDKPCPCFSGKSYRECCEPFHRGKNPETAVQLMRSRYSAYSINLSAYVLKTTHPASPQYMQDKTEWVRQIAAFSRHTQFTNLEILSSAENGPFATVTFIAYLTQQKKNVSFTERSIFEKKNGFWLYRSGLILEGHAPNLLTTHPLRLLPLAYYGHPILQKKADLIEDITPEIRQLADDMIETMDACDGVGLAAPQVHYSIQLFVMRKPIEEEGGKISMGESKVFINPIISLPSEDSSKLSEGCLSIPTIHAEVERPSEITIEYSDLTGIRFTERVSGLEARILSHETDHLNGILFIDRLSEQEKKQLQPFLHHIKNRIHDGTEL